MEQIRVFLTEKAGRNVARQVLRVVRNTVKFLAAGPEAGHVREDLTSRPLKFRPVYSYLIVYDSNTKPLQIVRVLHGMRDIEQISIEDPLNRNEFADPQPNRSQQTNKLSQLIQIQV